MADEYGPMIRWCGICGCPRPATQLEPCVECHDWVFSIVPNIQYTHGWLKRREAKAERDMVQRELFTEAS